MVQHELAVISDLHQLTAPVGMDVVLLDKWTAVESARNKALELGFSRATAAEIGELPIAVFLPGSPSRLVVDFVQPREVDERLTISIGP